MQNSLDTCLYPERIGEIPAPPLAQYNLLTGKPEPVPLLVDKEIKDEIFIEEDITLVKTKDASQIIISGYGVFLSKKSERLIVKKSGKAVYEFPFFRLHEVIIASRGISLSSDLVEEFCNRGIRVNFLSSSGRPYAMLSSPMLTAVVHSRREQFLAFEDERGMLFSREVLCGKVKNQYKLLRYFGKYLRTTDKERFLKLAATAEGIKNLLPRIKRINRKSINDVRGILMGLEGTSSRLYWDGIKEIISQKVEFFERETRGASDSVNALLNYGYGILYSYVWGAVVNAGLEPFAGFLHVDRPGKPSLVLDLIEEFRQPVVDRAVISYINLGEAIKVKDGLIEDETRKNIGAKMIDRLEQQEIYKGRRYKLRSIIQMQARTLASFLRGEKPYKSFSFKW